MTDRNKQSESQERRHRQDSISQSLPGIGNAIHLWIQQARAELWQNIIPFWLENSIDSVQGGFVGRMSNEGVNEIGAAKGLVLNARLLWSFSKMHQFTENPTCRKMANRAFDYILAHFWDTHYGGGFWNLNPDGSLLNSDKKIYGQAFLIYALSEHYLCTATEQSLKIAQQLFELLETHALDRENLGYFEVYNRDWSLAKDQRLSDEDMDTRKSMNNHLHLLEAFSNLYRAWKHPRVADRLKMLLELFCEKIINPSNGHLDLFFDEDWSRKSKIISFGHDIEASWLLCEAAGVLNDPVWIDKTRALGIKMAQSVYEKALGKEGGLYYEIDEAGQLNQNKEFWCQAEAAVGFLNAYQITRNASFYEAAAGVWKFIRNNQVDREHGEWFLRLDSQNRPIRSLPKISEWKDPYHNGRCCMELVSRLTSLLKTPVPAGSKEALFYE
jgi:mannobiose 2-epimerase